MRLFPRKTALSTSALKASAFIVFVQLEYTVWPFRKKKTKVMVRNWKCI